VLDAIDERQHRHQGQHDADRVEPTGVRVARFRHQHGREHEQREQHRHRNEEHGAPPEVLEQQPTDDRSQGTSGRESACPDGDREPTLVPVGKNVSDK
jgi:hypothetical protein